MISIKELPIVRSLLPPLYFLRYGQIWRWRERAFRNFLRQWPATQGKAPAGQEVLVMIQPWMSNPTPWFLLVLALGLSQRGRRVRVVWDDTAFSPDVALQWLEQRSLGRILSALPGPIYSSRLSEIPPSEDDVLSADAYQRLAYLNSIMRFHGETLPAGEESYLFEAEKAFRQTGRRLCTLLQQSEPAYILMGGGMYTSSGLAVLLARQLGIRVATIDSGNELLVISSDGIAAWFDDIPRAFNMLAQMDEADDWVVSEARSVLNARMRATDLSLPQRGLNSFQLVASSGQIEPVDILLPLNLSFDTAALGRHKVFDSQMQWIIETAAWVLKKTEASIGIRRHPGEQYKHLASNDDYEGALQECFGDNSRVRYITPTEPINTYDLIIQSRVVVPYVSTVGLEATALGKPVVTEGDSYYAKLGFVWSAESRDEYFALLGRALAGGLVVNEQQQRNALRCYYLTQLCSFLHTSFTPTPNDFDKWVRKSPREVILSQDAIDVLDVVDNNVPLAYILHRRKMRQRASKTSNLDEGQLE